MLWLILINLFVIGACIGSFINAANYRLIEGKSLLGRSACPECGHNLSPWELIPIFSYLAQFGRCTHCKKRISPRYPLVEAATALGFVFVGFWLINNFGEGFFNDLAYTIPYSLFLFFIVSILVAIAAIDFSWGIIPDLYVFPAIIITLVFKAFDIFYRNYVSYTSLREDSFGRYLLETSYFRNYLEADISSFVYALLCGLFISAFFFLLIRFTKGRAMGFGDVKFGFLIGFLTGWPAAVTSLFLAFLTGASAGIILILVRRKRLGQTIPFGPFLSLGALISFFYGVQILDYYLNIMK